MDEPTVTFERTIHGMLLWLLREYLVELGGTAEDDHNIRGDGWHAEIRQLEDYRLGSLAVGRIHLRVTGTQKAMDALLPELEKKLLRAGG